MTPALPSLPVTLRDRRTSDLPILTRWLTDPAAEWRRWDAPYFPAAGTTRTMEAYADYLAAHGPDADEQVIDVDGVVVGMVNRSEEEPEGGGWWDLGILIYDPAYWGGGVGTRALGLWVQDTLDWTDAHVLTVTTWGGNERMLRLGKRLGFRECARVRQARLWEGVRYDSVQLDLLRGEWRGLPQP
ncbi:GNAT family N-acetyltransferase [Deinococcus sp. SDU3-2]|uniref:GNAT family N-acetyltransferase n=1 Tax=Deinococcus terrestris TaxID=2651870 RepID=A0A7X1TQ18_9DEIO|nr:GNAT family protein [Deinococcus terrestris]MPY65125.1 GNAT family N-acetyltransferase [Deinococcus terrestris]